VRTIRRAGQRWREGAPESVVDIFDHPEYVDRYTVICKPVIEYNGKTYAQVLGTSESMGYSGWQELETYQLTQYRYRNKRKRIKWGDLPEKIREYLIETETERV
jgi:hypothetical protein